MTTLAASLAKQPHLSINIYGQDGKLSLLVVEDTPSNRKYAEWIRIHDRYTPNPQHSGVAG